MTPEQAGFVLRDRATVPVLKAGIRDVKELHARCLDHGIAAAMVRPCRRDGG
jgi:hypothetical protein